MATKKSSTPKRKSADAKPAPKKKGAELSDKDMDKVAGGMMYTRTKLASDSCTETGDTGMTGCPS
ncbi:MAG: hypothetical protein FIA95_16725 [Gemmatimonadetes bacterium]|nr:hypothetical protein [Gemmatimonadota bacterium]